MITTLSPDGEISGERFAPICLSFSYGSGGQDSCENVVRSVRYLLSDIAIDGFVALPMDALAVMNKTVGGVAVTIERDMTAADPAFVKGARIKLDDTNVESYIRARMALGDDDNLDRMSRQYTFFTEWMKAAKQKTASDPSFTMDLMKDLEDYVITDMTEKRLSSVANDVYMYTNGGTEALEGTYQMGTDYNEYVVENEDIQKILLSVFCEKE
jgi:anionic cell wall polymer biosynthesis LytR-Cps2A-Psr (LCP) family protein